jgi:hypothetical protein
MNIRERLDAIFSKKSEIIVPGVIAKDSIFAKALDVLAQHQTNTGFILFDEKDEVRARAVARAMATSITNTSSSFIPPLNDEEKRSIQQSVANFTWDPIKKQGAMRIFPANRELPMQVIKSEAQKTLYALVSALAEPPIKAQNIDKEYISVPCYGDAIANNMISMIKALARAHHLRHDEQLQTDILLLNTSHQEIPDSGELLHYIHIEHELLKQIVAHENYLGVQLARGKH